jgi:hypothetical protein
MRQKVSIAIGVPKQIDEARRSSVNVPAVEAHKGIEHVRSPVLRESPRVLCKKTPELMFGDLGYAVRNNAIKNASMSYSGRGELHHVW